MPENGETITGTIEKKSQYGIMIHGEWYNPHGKCKDYMADAIPGAEVELTMTGHKNDFRFIKVTRDSKESVSPQQPTAPAGTSTGYWEEKAERDKVKDVQISRHGAMNTAVSIMGCAPKLETQPLHQYLLMATTIADLVLRYVQADEKLQSDLIEKMTGANNE